MPKKVATQKESQKLLKNYRDYKVCVKACNAPHPGCQQELEELF